MAVLLVMVESPISLQLGKRTFSPFQSDIFCAQKSHHGFLLPKTIAKETLMDKNGLKVIKPCAINSHPA